MPQINKVSQNKCFGGSQFVFSHPAQTTHCPMQFGIFLPEETSTKKSPIVYWLSGLSCTEQNFITKAGAQRVAAELGIIIVVPDTSPRGETIPGATGNDNLGAGASFYLDATQQPWRHNYQMETYLTQELPALIDEHFSIDNTRVGLFGHSMGGHGALSLAIKNPSIYKSVSAFAPIASLTQSPWGAKALPEYLGPDKNQWEAYDAALLIEKKGWSGPPILIDQGTDDPFIEQQLKPQLFVDACKRVGVPCDLRMQTGYDHGYYFIASFIEDHLRYHAKFL